MPGDYRVYGVFCPDEHHGYLVVYPDRFPGGSLRRVLRGALRRREEEPVLLGLREHRGVYCDRADQQILRRSDAERPLLPADAVYRAVRLEKALQQAGGPGGRPADGREAYCCLVCLLRGRYFCVQAGSGRPGRERDLAGQHEYGVLHCGECADGHALPGAVGAVDHRGRGDGHNVGHRR